MDETSAEATDGRDPRGTRAARLLLVDHWTAADPAALTAALQVGDDVEILVPSSRAQAHELIASGSADATFIDLTTGADRAVESVHEIRSTHTDAPLLLLARSGEGPLIVWDVPTGTSGWIEIDAAPEGRLSSALVEMVRRHREHRSLDRYLLLARGVLDASDSPSCLVDAEGVIVAVNDAWERFGLDNGGSAPASGESVSYLDVCDGVDPSGPDADIAAAVARGLRDVLADRSEHVELAYPCHSLGEERWFSLRISPVEVDGARGAVLCHLDITELHQLRSTLHHEALHDALTGLPNRALLSDRLEQALVDAWRHHLTVGVGYVDLDHFDRINDDFGHRAGDELLRAVAVRLRARQREGDTIGRIAGDEFVIVWRDLQDAEQAVELAQELAGTLREPFDVGGRSVTLSASVGLVVSAEGSGVTDLLQDAHSAMHEVKRSGRSRVLLHRGGVRPEAGARSDMESELRGAVERSELEVHYQPLIELEDGRPVGLEALVRWPHPERGLLMPDELIPVAEAGG